MPYEVPTDFFDEFSRSVADRLSREQSAAVLAPSVVASAAIGRRRKTIVRRLALGIAAAVALFFLVRLTWTAPQPAEGDFEYVATSARPTKPCLYNSTRTTCLWTRTSKRTPRLSLHNLFTTLNFIDI